MLLRNNYYFFQNAISKENCNKILSYGKNLLEEAEKEGKDIYGSTSGKKSKQDLPNALPIEDRTIEEVSKNNIPTYVRDSKITWINEPWLYDLLTPFVKQANKNAGWNFDIDYHESCQFTVYEPGQFYGWHADGNSCFKGRYKRKVPGINIYEKEENDFTYNYEMLGKVRKISMTLNISPENSYEGGNLKFDLGPHEKERYVTCDFVRPQGSLIIFPSFLYHQVTPVTKGTRYSIVMWSNGNPFK